MQKVYDTIANNWVSWVLEIIVMSVIAFYTISENQKTQERTRLMIDNFEKSISAYASDKSKALDDAASAAKAEVKNALKPDDTTFLERAKKHFAKEEKGE